MIRLLTILLIGGGILIPLIWTVTVWRKQQRFRTLLKQEQCRLCGTGFNEALHEIQGPISPAERDRLDAFQRQYAAYRVLCLECNGVNLCADNGVPMKAYPA
jgi:hypothetical protein